MFLAMAPNKYSLHRYSPTTTKALQKDCPACSAGPGQVCFETLDGYPVVHQKRRNLVKKLSRAQYDAERRARAAWNKPPRDRPPPEWRRMMRGRIAEREQSPDREVKREAALRSLEEKVHRDLPGARPARSAKVSAEPAASTEVCACGAAGERREDGATRCARCYVRTLV